MSGGAMRARLRVRLVTGLGLLAAAVMAMIVVMIAGAAPASAHAILVGSDPSDGATVSAGPRQLRLRLSESVMPGTTKITLTDGAGRTVRLGGVHVGPTAGHGPALIYRAGDPGAPTTIIGDLPSLSPDVYRVGWQTLSAADLHLTSGVIVFGVQRGVTAAALPADDPLPPVAEVALRWLALVGTAVAGGALIVAHLGRELVPPAAAARLLRVGGAAGAVAVLAGAGLVVAQAGTDGAALSQVLGSGYGLRWGVRELLALGLAAGCTVPVLRRHDDLPRRAAWLGAAGVLAFAVATATLGHSGAGGLAQPVRFATDAVHVAAALLWLGLVAGVVVLVADRRARPRRRALARRVGVAAAASVAVVAVTGLLLAAAQVTSIDALLVSTYGRLLLGKLAVAAAGGVAALLVATAVRPGLLPWPPPTFGRARRSRGRSVGARGLRLLVAAEALALLGVVALAAGVASSRPASGPDWVPASAAVPLRAGQVRDLVETVAVSPNRPGRNFLTVDVFQTRRPEPGPIRSVTAVLTRQGAVPVSVSLRQDKPGRWLAPTDAFDAPGTWRVDVVVQREGVGADAAGYPWLVANPGARLAAPIVSSAPLEAPLEIAAGVLAVLIALAVWALRRRTATVARRPADGPTNGKVDGPADGKVLADGKVDGPADGSPHSRARDAYPESRSGLEDAKVDASS